MSLAPRLCHRVRPLLLAGTITLVACGSSHLGNSDESRAAQEEDASPLLGAPREVNISTIRASSGSDLMLALAAAPSAPQLTREIAARLAMAQGALPQALMPPVREQVRSDEQLKSLLSLPAGLGGLLASVFADDATIATKVRDGLDAKLTGAVAGASPLGSKVAFRFDGFTRLEGTTDGRFTLSDQIARWSLILGHRGLWRGDAPMAWDDHRWQALEAMRMMVEWKYLLGLDADPSGGSYGGLTFDPGADVRALAPFDPRIAPAGSARLVSGSYAVDAGTGTAIDLVLHARESWQRSADAPTLSEQALLWRVAAAAFARLRPEERDEIAGLFAGADPVFPEDAHQLALAFLPGMGVLLERSLIDPDARQIFATADGDTEVANLLDLTRLVAGVGAWLREVQDLSGAHLDVDTRAELEQAPQRLTPAIQLAVQTILNSHIRAVDDDGRHLALQLRAADDGQILSPAAAGEALVGLVEIERTTMRSPLLRKRIAGVARWFVEMLLPGVDAGSWTQADVLWALAALRALAPESAEYELGSLDRTIATLTAAAERLTLAGSSP